MILFIAINNLNIKILNKIMSAFLVCWLCVVMTFLSFQIIVCLQTYSHEKKNMKGYLIASVDKKAVGIDDVGEYVPVGYRNGLRHERGGR